MNDDANDWVTPFDGRSLEVQDESKLDLRPAVVQVRMPTSANDPRLLQMELQDALKYLRVEMAAHDATRARLAKLEEYVRDLGVMLEKSPVDAFDFEDHRADESSRQTRFDWYAK